MKNLIQSLKVVVLGLVVALGISYAFAWTPPTNNPPAGNVAAPVNVSASSQIKSGALSVNGFWNFGNSLFSGNVGIGTANPNAKLTVKDGGILLKQLVNNGTIGINNIGLSTENLDSSGAAVSMGVYKEPSGGGASTIFKNWNGSNMIEVIRIGSNGDVGIGTTAPAQKLDVSGKIRSSIGGFVFPDGTTQATSATTGTAITCNWNGGKYITLTNPGGECCTHTITCTGGKVTSIIIN